MDLAKIDFSLWEKSQITKMIFAIEKEMLKYPQVEIPIKHYFGHKSYAREVTIPAQTMLTGTLYKNAQINILSKGRMTLLSIDGGCVTIEAPFTVVSPVGVKRLAITHKETVWTTIFGTELIDPQEIMKAYTINEEVLCQE